MRLKEDAIPPRFSDGKDRIVYLLAEYKIGVMLSALAALILVATGRLGLPGIPSILTNALLSVALGILPSMALSKVLIVDRYIPDPREKVLTINLREKENLVEMQTHKVPVDLWKDRTHKEGMPALNPAGSVDSVVSQYDYDDAIGRIDVRGINRELADPIDTLVTSNQLQAVYDGLLDSKRDLMRRKNTERLRRQQVEENTVNAIVGAVEKGTVFSPSDDVLDEQLWNEPDRETDAVSEDRSNGHSADVEQVAGDVEQPDTVTKN